jgi:hypothetical protein
MVSVTPFCHQHNLGMHLVSAMVQGMGEKSILLYACPNEICERRYFEDSGGYGRVGDRDEFISVPEWGRKIAPLSASSANN